MKSKVTLRKPIENARLRKKYNVLLNVYSGDRVAFVNKPVTPLPRRVKIGDTMAMIYYKGQLLEKPLCTNCFMEGHFKRRCVKEAACMVCRECGHRLGDNTCPGKAKKQPIKMLLLSKDTNILSVISSGLKMGSRCLVLQHLQWSMHINTPKQYRQGMITLQKYSECKKC